MLGIVAFLAADFIVLGSDGLVGFYDLAGHNSRWHSNDSITRNHQQSGKQLTDGCDGHDVAEANSGYRYNGPVDRFWNARELVILDSHFLRNTPNRP